MIAEVAPASRRPVQATRVLDFGWAVVGPITTRALADFGATVVKVESSSWPDAARTAGPFKDGVPGIERSGMYALYNANKKSLGLNLRLPEAREVL